MFIRQVQALQGRKIAYADACAFIAQAEEVLSGPGACGF